MVSMQTISEQTERKLYGTILSLFINGESITISKAGLF